MKMPDPSPGEESPGKISVETLREWKAQLGPQSDVTRTAYLLSGEIVRNFLGRSWIEQYIKGASLPADFYFHDSASANLDVHMRRAIDLGEMLFNLQSIKNFDQCIIQLKGGQMEPAFAELEVGKILKIYNVKFCFVKPTGVTGSDYDLKVFFPDGRHVFADTKCKLQSTELSAETVRGSLETARKQLPKGKLGMVFLKLPQAWFAEDSLAIVGDAVEKSLQKTTRIVSVKVYGTLIGDEGSNVVQHIRGKEFGNESLKIFSDPVVGVGSNWTELISI
ncbi:MAG: hypothetical protein JWM97_3009 [Phycisphaerales bacterium]|nr:hypothetical protein [Phycisphaerales bacterium]